MGEVDETTDGIVTDAAGFVNSGTSNFPEESLRVGTFRIHVGIGTLCLYTTALICDRVRGEVKPSARHALMKMERESFMPIILTEPQGYVNNIPKKVASTIDLANVHFFCADLLHSCWECGIFVA